MVKYPTRDLALLDPELRELCERFLERCQKADLRVIVTQTHRSAEYQNSLYAQGRSQAELNAKGIRAKARPDLPKVTNATAGKSAHEHTKDGKPWSRAFDIAIQNPDGKLNWDTKSPEWTQVGRIGQEIGLEWGGAWPSFKDYPHFQLHNWRKRP